MARHLANQGRELAVVFSQPRIRNFGRNGAGEAIPSNQSEHVIPGETVKRSDRRASLESLGLEMPENLSFSPRKVVAACSKRPTVAAVEQAQQQFTRS